MSAPMTLDTLRDEVSVVLQNNVLFSGTIYENLRWGDKNATDEECRHACRLACADEFIDRFPDGYNTYIEQGGNQRIRRSETAFMYRESPVKETENTYFRRQYQCCRHCNRC